MDHILVTGGAGFIGSHVVKDLLRQGYQPVVYDNLQTGHRKAIGDASFVNGDLADPGKLTETFRSYPIRAVIHFAADCLVGESVENPLKYFKNNVREGIRLIEVMEEFGVDRIVFSSSAAVYGEPNKIPVTEEAPCLPANPYGETKWIFERILQTLFKTGRINFIALRYFNAAGADPEGELGEDHRPETHLIPRVIRAALGDRSVPIHGNDYDTPDGTCIRDYIHVNDLSHAHLLALKKLEGGRCGSAYNLGNGKGFSVREVIEVVRRVTGKRIEAVESPRRPGDPSRLVASSEKIKRELGWEQKYPRLETIVDTACQWFRKHPEGYEE
jgi:UDP-glucose 4-epimerase